MEETTANALREIADFLDQHPEIELRSIGVYSWLKAESPETFTSSARAMGVKPDVSDSYFASLNRAFGTIKFQICASKSSIGKKRTVIREVEEFVIGEAQ